MAKSPHVYFRPKNKIMSPCPSCGNSVKLYYEDYLCWGESKTKRVYFVNCKLEGCDSQGPKKGLETEAIDAWNRRELQYAIIKD